MKRSYKRLTLIFILLIATLIALSACNLSGISDALKTDISKCDISFAADKYEYTGVEIIPDTIVKFSNRVLERDTDYEVKYTDNIEIGTGHAIFTGKGNFKGEVTKDFEIVEKLPSQQDPNLPSGEINSGEVDNADYITYTFSADGAEVVSGVLIQKLESLEDFVLPQVAKRGYDFVGWTYEGEDFDFDEEDVLLEQDMTFVAKFDIITYSIEYNLNGGENDALNKSEYTVEDIFQLQDATSADKQFAGWYLDRDFDERIDSLDGQYGNLTLYAKFVDFDYKRITYVTPSDVENIPFDMVYPNTTLARPKEVLSADGSKELVWYIDEDMTIRHNLRIMPNENITLYARWEDKIYSGFLEKGWYRQSDIKSIDSYDDLLAYIEFVCYYNITDRTVYKTVTYFSDAQTAKTQFDKAVKENTFPRMLGVWYHYLNGKLSVYMTTSTEGQATLSATSQDDFYPQIGHVFNSYDSNRDSNYDDFAIGYVENTYECETSDQLFYVLSHGYRPLPVSGSAAYRIYNSFKEIMRGICDDRMSDVQKARAIYDWLIVNVYYDNKVADTTLPQANYKYNAFYLEGVLNGAAVCDGLSKAYAVMCAIEGIDCVRVTGKLKDAADGDAGHAWNKIQLMGDWYLSDSTWGNRTLVVTDEDENKYYYEYVNGQYFLFTDEERELVDNYNSDQYTYYVADNIYNYYSNNKMQLEYRKGNLITGYETYTRSFDLYLDGDASQEMSAEDELSYVFEYIDKNYDALDGMSFCIMLGEDMSTDDVYNALRTYIDRVGYVNAGIKGYRIVGNRDDVIDSTDDVNTYGAGAILTIIFSLPTASQASVFDAA